jgi:hypothetical protein
VNVPAPAPAAELTREAAEHLRASGAAPAEEFGPADQYAAKLAEHEDRRPPWWLRKETGLWLMTATAVYYAIKAPAGNWSLLNYVPITILLPILGAYYYRRTRRRDG